jgi:hypothetical protein
MLIAAVVSGGSGFPLYFTAHLDSAWDIYRMNTADRSYERLTQTLWDEKDIALSEDRTRLVFCSTDGYVKVMDLSEDTVIDSFTTKEGAHRAAHPVFYDSAVVFSLLLDLKTDYSVIAQRTGNTITHLITKQASLFFPVVLTGTQDIVYTYRLCLTGCPTYVSELWHYDKSTGMNRQVSLERAFIIDPAPLGSDTVLFASNKAGTMDIYHIDIATGTTAAVIATGKEELKPVASPSGETIAFIQKSRGKTALALYHRHKKTTEIITPAEGRYLDLAW